MSDFRLYAADELGADGYPAAWHARIKHQVRHDAGHRCVRCHHPYEKGAGEWSLCDRHCTHPGGETRPFCPELDGEGEPFEVEARWRILTVHHLDGNKANCRWWNLVALCQRCHLEIQGKVVMDRVWPYEHTTWFQPYVAGFYAHRYRGVDVTREEAEQRLDEFLALEVHQLTLGGMA